MYTLMTDTGKRFLAPLSKDFFQILPYISGVTMSNFIEMFEEYIILQKNDGSKKIKDLIFQLLPYEIIIPIDALFACVKVCL